MPLFRNYRRYWCLFALGLLCTPFIAHFFTKFEERSLTEGRLLASPPAMPITLQKIIEFPKKTDAFLNDHYGLRTQFLFTYALIRYALKSTISSRVFYGKDGWLFYSDRNHRSLKKITPAYDKDRLKEIYQFADFLSIIDRILRQEGRTFVVAIPPNKQSIYSAELPLWLQNQNGPTEYDILLSELEKRTVKNVNLSLVLREAAKFQPEPLYYPHDTHWNFLGAIIAYNASVIEANREDWAIDLENISFTKISHSGDLARMLGLSGYLYENAPKIRFPGGLRTDFRSSVKNFNNHSVVEYKKSGTTVLVIGDSFTRHYLRAIFSKHAARLVWTHHQGCKFDWSLVNYYQPDIVFYMPVERDIGCLPNARPKGIEVSLFNNSPASLLKIAGFSHSDNIKPITQLSIADQAGEDDAIILNATGRDPQMWLPLFDTKTAQSFSIKIEMESPVESGLELYYMTEFDKKFSRDKKISHKTTKGVNIIYLYLEPVGKLYGKLRLDIGSAPGTYKIKNIEIRANVFSQKN